MTGNHPSVASSQFNTRKLRLSGVEQEFLRKHSFFLQRKLCNILCKEPVWIAVNRLLKKNERFESEAVTLEEHDEQGFEYLAEKLSQRCPGDH